MREAPMPRWLERGYSDIIAVRLKAPSVLEVDFGNGDRVEVSTGAFGLDAITAVELDPEEGLSVRLLNGDGRAVEVSATRIRSSTDAEYAHELRRLDAEQSRRLGLRLKALREDRNLSQRDLAHLVGMPPPQLSKIESGSYDLRVSTVQTLLRAMDATFADIAGPNAPEVSRKTILKYVHRAGVPRDLVSRILSRLDRASALDVLARAFGWPRAALVVGELPPASIPVPVRLKTKGNQRQTLSPLLALAYNLSVELHPALRKHGPEPHVLPSEASDIRETLLKRGEAVTLESLLRWSWDSGIAVIPLHGRGAFSAAAWTVDHAPLVVIKETREFAVYWLFDLAHEIGHIVLGHVDGGAVVDVDTPIPRSDNDKQEDGATTFALDLLLPNRISLLSEVRSDARGSHLRFKGAVERVAAKHRISPALLGMIAAYELVEVGEYKDRWGSASNLAKPEGSGRDVVETVLRDHLDEDLLSPQSRLVVGAAILTNAELRND
jgi:transcriptional regulator with XRE-family HTH domain/Zn-dependent peptidase ImmA (M78 family)